jgi:hypothetical protein
MNGVPIEFLSMDLTFAILNEGRRARDRQDDILSCPYAFSSARGRMWVRGFQSDDPVGHPVVKA